MDKIDIEFRTNRSQGSVHCIRQGICRHIICWSELFAFEYAPKGFCYVQIRRVRRQEEKKQSSFFPDWPEFSHELTSVYPSVVQDDKSVLLYPERKPVKEVCNFIGSDVFSRAETVITIVAVYHAEDIESKRLLRRDKDFFLWELPAMRHISFRADMAFFTLCLSFSMATRTAFSWEQSIIGLRPRPGRVSNPWMPSDSKRFTHELTDICVISVCSPTLFDVKLDDLKRTARQRIRNAWLLPLRKPSSSCRRWASVSSITLICAIVVWIYMFTQEYTIILI